VCCPDTGSRADDGELFVTLQLSGRVTGSQYGQATVSTDAVRLVVDGQPEPPIEFAGRPNTPEGEAFDFAATWVVRESDPGLALQFLDGPDVAEVVPVGIGPDAPVVAAAARSAPSMVPSAALSPVPSSAAAATTSSASAAPTAAAAPTPRPVLAAITTLLMYSGVPDPGWPLMTDDLAQLEAIAAGLETVEQAVPEGGLGYRGFRVTGPQGAWRANEGFVMAPSSAPGTALADPDRLVERFLLERGLPELTPEELAIAQEAIGSPLPAGSTAPRPTDG
jgi:hypothetical protein